MASTADQDHQGAGHQGVPWGRQMPGSFGEMDSKGSFLGGVWSWVLEGAAHGWEVVLVPTHLGPRG